MPKIQPTESIKLSDEKTIKVSELSSKSKDLIVVYDEWRQKLFDANQEVQLISTAVQAVLNQIRTEVLNYLAPKTETATETATEAAQFAAE
jgi:cell fate (sporulation/competence/biofilm development) regulator YmcA (YheA/YmcA/DUF963 family)